MPPTADELCRFLEWLRDGQSGFEASDQQYLAAYRLLESLVAVNEWPETMERWTTLLGPVLCSSSVEQEDFGRLFGQWFELGKVIPKPDEQTPKSSAKAKRNN